MSSIKLLVEDMSEKSVVRNAERVDGNIYSVIGAARRALESDSHPRELINEMIDRVYLSESYGGALGIIQEYVEFDFND